MIRHLNHSRSPAARRRGASGSTGRASSAVRAHRARYEPALREHDVPVREEWIVEGGFGEEDGYVGTTSLLDTEGIPDAIFAITFPVALGVENALRRDDRVSPDQVQIYSFGQHSLNRFCRHPHVSVCQPAREMGEKALSLLLEEVTTPEQEPQEVTLPTRVVEPEEITPPYLRADREETDCDPGGD